MSTITKLEKVVKQILKSGKADNIREILNNTDFLSLVTALELETIKELIVKENPDFIQYIDNPSEKIQMLAVRIDGLAIQFIKNPTTETKLEAIKNDGYAIQFIKDPTEEMQILAVQQNGNVIKFIKNPSEKIQEEAIKQNFNVLRLDIISNSVKNQVFDNNEENLELIFSSIDKAINEKLKEKNQTLKKN